MNHAIPKSFLHFPGITMHEGGVGGLWHDEVGCSNSVTSCWMVNCEWGTTPRRRCYVNVTTSIDVDGLPERWGGQRRPSTEIRVMPRGCSEVDADHGLKTVSRT